MKQIKDTRHVAIGREAHEGVRNVAFIERKTMRQVVEEALTIAYKDKYPEISALTRDRWAKEKTDKNES